MPDGSDDDDAKGGRAKSRRELPAGAVATLKAWLLSPEHFTHPYPTPQDQVMLMQKTGIDKKQLKNWFTNARRRIWKPMLKKQLEQGKLAAAVAGGVGVPGVVQPQLVVPQMAGMPPADQAYQQQPMQQQMGQHEVSVDQYGNPVYTQRTVAAPVPSQQPQYYEAQAGAPMTQSQPLPPVNQAPNQQLSKTDSHAVLMELFARDRDLVRQATESAGLKSNQEQGQTSFAPAPSQPPMKVPSQARMINVPTLNSWPHFSSVSSLNNLGNMPGVKSITSLSLADLAKQGPVNGTIENLAQVKSIENMGKNDSYAFLEVFFGERSSNALSSMGGKNDQRGIKREREEDNDVGLSLEDEGPSTTVSKPETGSMAPAPAFGTDKKDSTGTLKRAYDDALAARGLISVSRSCEKLTDLALPAKIQRTLSQEFLRQRQGQDGQQSQPSWYQQPSDSSQGKTPQPAPAPSHQYPGQHPGQQQNAQLQGQSEPHEQNASVKVSSATTCAICAKPGVDTQLRPCGRFFHERCLKPYLQSHTGVPMCPIDNIPIQSALLAIPTDEAIKSTSATSLTPSWRSIPSIGSLEFSAASTQG
mmetsp:Transcript_7662/g.18453  ORF Transcript_7662/g.18453 Transcript_7662/m.18453 type:complete len:586 (-) Transcript_7662:1278-3035(-)|eukprot:CAMPEP_0113622744 /NCGR_PEP_ID=MMETSP0017_2-20120614/11669_1 /TAXON_ID=2856 /ORGANISM="Cylindrotheca closterium" /LENGTH=585 /DNA_ID=CAMNT_0000532611 /DNA_START=509 /DNA_END=2266 /DNA_ORIENTATION=- /assembly_acc=CAM_ASM_000147